MSKKSMTVLSKVIGIIMILVGVFFSLIIFSAELLEGIGDTDLWSMVGTMAAFVIFLMTSAIGLIGGILLMIQSKISKQIAKIAGIFSILFGLLTYLFIIIDFDLGDFIIFSILILPLIIGGVLLIWLTRKTE